MGSVAKENIRQKKGMFVVSKDGPKCCLLAWKVLFASLARAGSWSLAAFPLKACWDAGAHRPILEAGKEFVPLGRHLVMHGFLLSHISIVVSLP